jgi:hypothetical protein
MGGEFGHPQDMETGGRPEGGVCAAVDVQYLPAGGARAAAVLAADAVFPRGAGRARIVEQVAPKSSRTATRPNDLPRPAVRGIADRHYPRH